MTTVSTSLNDSKDCFSCHCFSQRCPWLHPLLWGPWLLEDQLLLEDLYPPSLPGLPFLPEVAEKQSQRVVSEGKPAREASKRRPAGASLKILVIKNVPPKLGKQTHYPSRSADWARVTRLAILSLRDMEIDTWEIHNENRVTSSVRRRCSSLYLLSNNTWLSYHPRSTRRTLHITEEITVFLQIITWRWTKWGNITETHQPSDWSLRTSGALLTRRTLKPGTYTS